jgi:hypothetical protein
MPDNEINEPGHPMAPAGMGHNNPPLARSIAAETEDFAHVVTRFLEEEYRQYPDQLNALLEAAAQIPETIDDQESKEAAATIIKQFRDLNAKFDSFQKKEKQPYLRGGQAVDQFFFGMMDKIMRRARTNRFGTADILLQRITDFDNRKLAEEQARRQREADERARIAREAQQRADRERREAEERQRAAERARTEATRTARAAEAETARQAAQQAAVEEVVTSAQAQEAHIATLARPADLMRQRGNDGTLTTVTVEKYAAVTNKDALDKDKLWPFINIREIEKALAAWAKTTDYNVQMDGAEIGRRNRSVVR